MAKPDLLTMRPSMIISMIAVSIVILALSACASLAAPPPATTPSPDPSPQPSMQQIQKAVLGTWRQVECQGRQADPSVTVEFLSNGTLIQSGSRAFKYSFLDGQRLRIDSGSGVGQVVPFTVLGDRLTLLPAKPSDIACVYQKTR